MNRSNRIISYTYAYALWILSIGLSLLAAMILRETVIFSVMAGELHRYTIHLITQVTTILLGVVLVITLVVLENRYRTGLANGRTRGRFLRFAGWVLLAMAVIHLWYALIAWRLGTIDQFRLVAAAAETAVGLLALRLAKTSAQSRT